MVKAIFITVLMVVGAALPREAFAQGALEPPEAITLSGPRIGVTFLNSRFREKLRTEIKNEFGLETNLGPAISQFGWQWEKRFLSSANGWSGVNEWVVLIGGLDQGTTIPSGSWLVGLRSLKGLEFAVGPNVTPAGVALAVAAGVTLRSGNLNFPINVAAVPSKEGVRVSMLVGFTMRR